MGSSLWVSPVTLQIVSKKEKNKQKIGGKRNQLLNKIFDLTSLQYSWLVAALLVHFACLLLCFNTDAHSWVLCFSTWKKKKKKNPIWSQPFTVGPHRRHRVRTNKSSWWDNSKQNWAHFNMVQLEDCEYSSHWQRHGYTVRRDSGKGLQINCCWGCMWRMSSLLFIKYAAPSWLASTPLADSHPQRSE